MNYNVLLHSKTGFNCFMLKLLLGNLTKAARMLETQNCLQIENHIKSAKTAKFLYSYYWPSTLPKDAPAKFYFLRLLV